MKQQLFLLSLFITIGSIATLPAEHESRGTYDHHTTVEPPNSDHACTYIRSIMLTLFRGWSLSEVEFIHLPG